VEWLGEIPEGWEKVRFRNFFKFSKGLNITKENLQEKGIPCVNYGEIHSKYGFEFSPEKHPLKCVSEDYLKVSPKALLQRGDFVFADTSEDINGSGNFTQLIGDHDVFAGYHTIIARPRKSNNHRFLAYVLESISYRNQIRQKVKGVKVYSITKSILKNTFVWLPPRPEQKTIADFLDRKTGQIDAAVAIKKKQIKLLKERKQILIQHAVTQGLNPDAAKRDSGVEWIGEIPEGWKVKRIKFLFSIGRGRVISQQKLDDSGSYPVYSSQTKDNGVLGYINTYDFDCQQITWTTDGANAGTVFLREGKHNCTNVCGTLQPTNNRLSLKFITNALGVAAQFYKRPDTNGAKIMNGEMSEVFVTFPPFPEQKEIAEYIEKESAKIDQAIHLNQQQIEKLNEYKTTLINSAVTGKIKIPGKLEAFS